MFTTPLVLGGHVNTIETTVKGDRRRPLSARRVDRARRQNWLFAGSLRAGQPAAAAMSLVYSARLNGHQSHACDPRQAMCRL